MFGWIGEEGDGDRGEEGTLVLQLALSTSQTQSLSRSLKQKQDGDLRRAAPKACSDASSDQVQHGT